ncbi:hypothetical protein [Prosthecobacter vanneervenii]|uniref:Uncharacterized protein n=1 Tax=Prosthecobacter vanneervenii TaxID=48466 RepID=A0A7W7Y9G0_9BACT|nr:hypothetical protein [Prosthecobacter vanneervenii]MBB5032026.1 hypothetical protein [Prosthecobacter vanneervenii]
MSTPLAACLWDRDTIAMEAQGRLEVVETMVGWFDRFPPEYYQMRLDRVTHELATEPQKLELYDDAAVSSDRLGRHDEAVVWMEKKNTRMQPLPPEQTKDHRYRMHANLGVFRTHQWLKTAERNTHSEKLENAIAEVQAALEINPDAHFGRERAHLSLLQWWQAGLKNPSKATDSEFKYNASALGYASFGDFPGTTSISRDALIKGFCGLIQMGSAQDSVDVHSLVAWHLIGLSTNRLRVEYSEVRYTLCYLACLRLAELVSEGRLPVYASDTFRAWLLPETHFKERPMWKEESQTEAFAERLSRMNMWGGNEQSKLPIAPWFYQARAAAKQRLAAKTHFMQTRFAAGMHPDTHADFWQGWQEPKMPPVPETQLERWFGPETASWLSSTQFLFLCLFSLSSLCVVAIYIILKLRKRRLPLPSA